MNKKEMFLFNRHSSNCFLPSFRPSSTPGTTFPSPGLSNKKNYTIYVKSYFNTPPLVFQKETKEEIGKTHFVQEGKGQEDTADIFDPIKVGRTLLQAHEANNEISDVNKVKEISVPEVNKSVPEVKKSVPEVELKPKGSAKRKTEVKNVVNKKSKFMFNLID